MKKLVALVALVMLQVNEEEMPVGCPQPAPQVVRNVDGTYVRFYPQQITLQQCYTEPKSYQEEWTDYPEKGGTLISTRRVK